MNMFFLDNKECCGCAVCSNVCPSDAIVMKEDKIGFLYPHYNKSKCINCNKCVKHCPVIVRKNTKEQQDIISAYAGYAIDKNKLMTTASGGIATVLSEKMVDNGGIVCGVVYKESYAGAKHIVAETRDKLKEMRGSKYIQSDKGKIYYNIKEKLEQDIEVLFIGTPCEVAAIKSFLHKSYDNLYTCELICHGPTSYKIQNIYIKKIEKEHDNKIRLFSVRSKINGWKIPHLHVEFENGDEITEPFYNTELGNLFTILPRESCCNCFFKGENKVADITIGDYWGLDVESKMWNEYGVSCIITHSIKGEKLIENINDEFKLFLSEYSSIVKGNPLMIRSTICPDDRDKIAEIMISNGIDKAIDYAKRKRVFLFRVSNKIIKILTNKLK